MPVLAALACVSPVFFRHFVSLDGPMHLLHAEVIRAKWAGHPKLAAGIQVDVAVLDLNLGDLLLLPLGGWLHPFWGHKLLAAVAVTSVVMGSWRLTRAYVPITSSAWLLVLPFTYSFVMILGFFHFMIGTGLALGLCGWWISRSVIGQRELLLLALGCALGTFAHKAGGALLLLLAGTHEFFLFMAARGVWRERWRGLPRWFPAVAAFCCVGLGAAAVLGPLSALPVHPPAAHSPMEELLSMRPLLLLDRAAELPWRVAIGGLFVALMAMSILPGEKTGSRTPNTLPVLALVLLVLSLFHSPRTDLHYITDRAQWVALLLLACWLGTRKLPRRATHLTTGLILAVHIGRLAGLEERMHAHSKMDRGAYRAGRSFRPGSLVMAVVLEQDWLARHRTAWTAIAHDGIVLTPRDHLRFRWDRAPSNGIRAYLNSPHDDWGWLASHLEEQRAPRPDHILVIGDAPDPRWSALVPVLERKCAPLMNSEGACGWSCAE